MYAIYKVELVEVCIDVIVPDTRYCVIARVIIELHDPCDQI